MEQLKSFEITARFIFSREVEYNGVLSKEHVYKGINQKIKFDFSADTEFQLVDMYVNGNSVKEHVFNSVDFFDFVQKINKDTFLKTHRELTLDFYETDWICVIGPFSRHKIASRPESGPSETFYYITWFGHARPGTNIEITGTQVIAHNQDIMDKWVMQKRMWGEVGKSRARVFFSPPFRYLD